MSGQAGKDVLLKIGDGGAPEAFTIIAGIRAKSISLSAETIESTSADSPNRWRELIGGAGVKSCAVSGSGVFADATSDARMRSVFFAQDAVVWQLIVPDFGIIEGPFLFAELNYSGNHDGEAAFAVTLASAGELTFTVI